MSKIFQLVVLLIPTCGFAQEGNKPSKIGSSYDYIERAARIPIVQSVMLDSISQKLAILERSKTQLFSASQLKDTSLSNKIMGLKNNFKTLELANIYPSSFLSKFPAFYSLKQHSAKSSQNAFSLSSVQVSNQIVYDNFFLSGKQLISTSDVSFSSKMASIPFSTQVVYAYPSTVQQDFSGLFKTSFNREALLADVKKQLSDQFDINKLLLRDFDFKQLFHQHAQSKLNYIKQSVQSIKGLQALEGINNLSTEEFLYLTKNQLREKFTNKALSDSLMLSQEKIKQELATEEDIGKIKLLNQQLDSIRYIKNSLANAIEKMLLTKNDFETKDFNYNQIVNYQKTINSNLDSIGNSDGFVQQTSQKLLKLNGLTKFFMYVKEMNLGKFSTDWSDGSMSNILTSGIGGSFLKNNKFLGLNISNIKSLGWIKDNQFIASIQQPEAALQSLRVGKGELEGKHSHITLTNAKIRNLNSQQDVYSLLPRNTFVGSFSKNLSLGTYGNIETEVSKSSSQYTNTRSSINENQVESKMAFRHLGDDFFQSLSLRLNYNGNFDAIHFKPSFFASYSGLGYNNPASSSQSRGALSYGVNMSKGFLANQLTIYTRLSKRVNETSTLDNKRFTQLQGAFSTKYKFSRKIRAGLNWNYSDLFKETNHSQNKLYYSNRIYTDASFNGKLKNLPLYQLINIGYQNISIPDMPTASLGKNIWINSGTNLAMTKGTLSINMQLFDQLNNSLVQGDLLTTDMGWTFVAFRRLNLSTAINYLSQHKIARQLGVRQTLSASVMEKLSINLFADIRRDLIENKNSFMFPNTRGEVAIAYKIN